MNQRDAKADAIGHVTRVVRVTVLVHAAAVMEDVHLIARIVV